MNIIGNKVIIRAIEKNDLEILNDMINDPDIEKCVGGWSFPVSMCEQMKWYDGSMNDSRTKRFMIDAVIEDKKETIGMIYISDIDWKNRSISTGIKLLNSAPHKQGYATDAVITLVKYVFEELQMNRVTMKILSNNYASIKLYEKCGARREGILREAVYKNGKYCDQYCYSILKSEFYS